MRSRHANADTCRASDLRLIDVAERHGVRAGVAMNAVLDNFSALDMRARLRPQTARLKAALLGGELTGDPKYTMIAADAAASMIPYLQTVVPGLWFDEHSPEGTIVDGPAPASTFYHLVTAAVALDRTRPRSRARPGHRAAWRRAESGGSRFGPTGASLFHFRVGPLAALGDEPIDASH